MHKTKNGKCISREAFDEIGLERMKKTTINAKGKTQTITTEFWQIKEIPGVYGPIRSPRLSAFHGKPASKRRIP